MKLSNALDQVKKEKPHSFSENHCTLFITEIEAQVQEYLGIPAADRIEYAWDTDKDKELIVPSPYDALYISFLKAKIDYANEEYESYANNQAIHDDDMANFRAWAIREDKLQNKTTARITNWW